MIVRQGFLGLSLTVTGGLELRRAQLRAPRQGSTVALGLYRATLGDLYLTNARLEGGLYAIGLQVERNVRLQGAEIASREAIGFNRGSDAGAGLELSAANIGSTLYLSSKSYQSSMSLNERLALRGTTCRIFAVSDDQLQHLAIEMPAFVFARLGSEATYPALLNKLDRDPFDVNSYLHFSQLDAVRSDLSLRRRCLTTLQTRLSRTLSLRSPARWSRTLFDVLAGYGYKPGRSLLWLSALVLVTLALIQRFGSTIKLKDNPSESLSEWDTSALYVLDSLLPFSPLGVAGLWTFAPVSASDWLFLFVFLLIKFACWCLALLAVASVTGLVRRD